MPVANGVVRPDITYRVLPEDYERALAADAMRWLDATDERPVWNGRRAWRLRKGVAVRAMYRLLAFSGNLTVHSSRGAA
jgi:hypothetical protein